MDKKDIEVFLAIVSEKSISKASALLYFSPSTIGTRLSMLEKELGVELIVRKKGIKEIILTKKGEEFIGIAKNWMALWNECGRLKNTEIRPYLSIATVDSILEFGFVDLYRKLVYEEPYFNIDIKCYPADMIYDLVSKKVTDIGFALYEIKYPDVLIEQVMADEMVVIVPGNYETSGGVIHPDELDSSRELYVGSKDNLNIGWGPVFKMWHEKWFDISVCPLVAATSITMLSYFLTGDNFWSIIPLSNAMGLKDNYDIKILRLDPSPPERRIFKLTHSSKLPVTENNIEIFNSYLNSYIETMEFKL
jgi:DNA-binding transcriptional LysR family regulator